MNSVWTSSLCDISFSVLGGFIQLNSSQYSYMQFTVHQCCASSICVTCLEILVCPRTQFTSFRCHPILMNFPRPDLKLQLYYWVLSQNFWSELSPLCWTSQFPSRMIWLKWLIMLLLNSGLDCSGDPFHKHVFLEHHLHPWCPPSGPIR